MQSTARQTFQHAGSLAACTLAAVLVPADMLLLVMIVQGQAHFSMAYLYQYKAGRIDRSYLLRYALGLALVIGTYSWFPHFDALAIVAATYFVVHFIYDELYLVGEKPAFRRFQYGLPALLFYCGLILRDRGVIDDLLIFKLLGSGALVLVAMSLVRRGREALPVEIYLACVSTAVAFATWGNLSFFSQKFMQLIILAHYLNWYVYYYEKLRARPVAFREYLANLVTVNLGITLLAVGYVVLAADQLRILFRPDFFYLWTLMHYVATFRRGDLANWRIEWNTSVQAPRRT